MDKYIVQYLTQEYGALDDREVEVEAASSQEAIAKVSNGQRHAYYAERVEVVA